MNDEDDYCVIMIMMIDNELIMMIIMIEIIRKEKSTLIKK